MTSGASSDQAELTFPGDGEMARRMRAFDWAASPSATRGAGRPA